MEILKMQWDKMVEFNVQEWDLYDVMYNFYYIFLCKILIF